MAPERDYLREKLVAFIKEYPPEPYVPCSGKAEYFDMDDISTEEGFTGGTHDIFHRQVLAVSVPGLEMCSECPIANRNWCLKVAKPRETHMTGIAGGIVWWRGRRIGDIQSVLGVRIAA